MNGPASLLWSARRLCAAAGAPLLLAGGALLLSGVLALAWGATRDDIEALRLAPVAPAASAAEAVSPQAENNRRLADFARVLPARQAVPDILEALFRLGDKEGVALARGDYRLLPVEGELIRCELRFPVTGDTGRLERFVRAALRRFPALALDGVRFEREQAGESVGEAEIRFVLFMATDTRQAGLEAMP